MARTELSRKSTQLEKEDSSVQASATALSQKPARLASLVAPSRDASVEAASVPQPALDGSGGVPAALSVDRLAQEQAVSNRDVPRGTVDRFAQEQQELKVAFCKLIAEGMPVGEVLSTLGIDLKLAIAIKASPDFEELVRAHIPKAEDIRDMLAAHGGQAAQTIVKLMKGAKSEEEQGRSARDLLDRIGVVPRKQVAVAVFHFQDSKSKLVEETLRELRGAVVQASVE